MRTVVIDGPRSIRVDTRPDPELPGPDGAIVSVTAAGICGSDLHFYEGDFPLAEPVALGHEAVGTVVEAGQGQRTIESIAAVIDARDRRAAGPTVPALGLTLMAVRY